MFILRKGKDYLVTDDSKNHILVIHRGNFYTFPVLNNDGINNISTNNY